MDSLRNILAIAILLTAGELRPQTLLSIGSQTAYPGASVNVPVTFTRATNVVAAQFDVTFDPDRVASGPAVADQVGRHVVLSREIAPGVRRVLMFSRQNSVVTNRNPVQLPFAVAPTEYQGSGPLAPANAILARANATPVAPLALGDGAIFVRQVNMLPDGRVQFFLPSTPHQRYYIQASTNLSTWVNISTNIATGTFLDLIDLDAPSYPYRFYRWQSAD